MPSLDIPADPVLAAWPERGRFTILDLEYTAWENSLARGWSESWEWREIIQVGAIVVEAQNFDTVESYEAVIKPTRNPVLSEYFTTLTGITQADVDNHGRHFPTVMAEILKFSQKGSIIVFNGNDGQILVENCAFNGIDSPFMRDRMFNFRPLLARQLDREASELTSSSLPSLAGVNVDFHPHSGLGDCHAIATALAEWRKKGLL